MSDEHRAPKEERQRRFKQPKAPRAPRPVDESATSTKLASMRTATDVIKRVRHEDGLRPDLWTVGYEDRFLGVVEKPFNDFNWCEPAMAAHYDLSIPKHRVVYFKFHEEVVWDKAARLDRVFGSAGSDVDISAVLESHGDLPSPSTSDADEDAQGEQQRDGVPRRHSDRPNHFICLRLCDSPEVAANVRALQERLVAACPALAEAVVPPSLLHITLVMLRIDTEEHMRRAQQVVTEARSLLAELLPPSHPLRLRGLRCFRDRVLVTQPADCEGVDALAMALRERLRVSGVPLKGNHDPYTAHATILKLSRQLSHSLGTIPREVYAADTDLDLGAQPPFSIQLCSGRRPSLDSGAFYESLASASTAVPPPPPVPVTGLLELASSLREKEMVVLRGLPGSGKSQLVAALGSTALVCSADDHFRSEAGYRWAAAALPEAHAACLAAVRASLADPADRRVVVVDNTHATAAEYAPYLEAAAAAGVSAHVWEIACRNRVVATHFFRRCAHAVPLQAVLHSLSKWEADEAATVLEPAIATAPSLRSVLYAGIRLDRDQVLAAVPAMFPRILADHVTICFRPDAATLSRVPEGAEVAVTLHSVVHNDRVQAVLVRVPPSPELPWDADSTPHLTLSTAPTASARESHALCSATPVPLPAPITLTGTVVLVGVAGARTEEGGAASGADADLAAGPAGVQHLAIFDMDDTLLMTPDPAPGRAEYDALTGAAFEGDHWISAPGSMDEPLLCAPGPALAAMRDALGQVNTHVVVLTGRREPLRDVVQRRVWAAGGDADAWFLRPLSVSSSAEFKASMLRRLVLETYPNLRTVTMYEDRADNVAVLRGAMAELSQSEAARGVEFSLVDVMAEPRPPLPDATTATEALRALRGAAVTPTFASAAKAAVLRVMREWKAVTNGEGLMLPAGSSALGRRGDQDVVLLAPAGLSHAQAVLRLAERLAERGFSCVHAAADARCPRLLVQVRRQVGPAIEVDASVCVLQDLAPVAELQAQGRPLAEICVAANAQVAAGDQRSAMAILGSLHAASALRRLEQTGADLEAFAAAMEFVLAFLEAQGLRSAALLCPRPFQLVDVALRSEGLGPGLTADEVLRVVAAGLAAQPYHEWLRALGGLVPDLFVRPLMDALSALAASCQQRTPPQFAHVAERMLACYAPCPPPLAAELLRLTDLLRPSPAAFAGFEEGALRLRIEFSAPGDAALQWRLRTVVHSRLPTLVGTLAKHARQMRPVRCTGGYAELLVGSTKRMDEGRLRALVQPFLDDLYEWRAQGGLVSVSVS